MSEIKNKTKTLINDRIEDLINKSSDIPHSEVIKLMMKAKSNPKFNVKKKLENLSKINNKS